ncbi:hypothetical protein GCM10020000_00160 [Streptomyces olivoverticillatus]
MPFHPVTDAAEVSKPVRTRPQGGEEAFLQRALVRRAAQGRKNRASQEVVAVVIGPPLAGVPLVPGTDHEPGGFQERALLVAQSRHRRGVHRFAKARDLPQNLLDGEALISPPVRREAGEQFNDRCVQRDAFVPQHAEQRRGGEDLCQRRNTETRFRRHRDRTMGGRSTYARR